MVPPIGSLEPLYSPHPEHANQSHKLGPVPVGLFELIPSAKMLDSSNQACDFGASVDRAQAERGRPCTATVAGAATIHKSAGETFSRPAR
jgi:hypothetical protein